ncbi:MAG: hypothetical protein FD123_270 [Bacteroidetes bacterium]|nr:MAG: hypothetical protein FD123_270 [Bacteroidota bacterium]
MTHSDFVSFNDQPCRFKLKAGKEIFGIIRELHGGYYFSTLAERTRKHYAANSDSLGQAIDLEDVIGAELLSSSDLMVS